MNQTSTQSPEKGTENSPEKPTHTSSMWTDLGPVIAYVIVFNLARRFTDSDTALYIGTGVFALAIIIAVIVSKVKTGHVSVMLWVTAVIVLGSAAITIGLKNPTVFKMKPTALNVLFGASILGSLAMGKNLFRLMLGEVYTLPDAAWRTLAFRWGVFFFFLAGLNEYIWRTYSTDFWSNFKLMGMFPITIAFTMLNLPLLLKHMPQEDVKEGLDKPNNTGFP
ncbi:MAG TPA: septation protein IspZ [Hellea balneolensis]|uniref:Inner membrane-spanning protein YciB n=1 Tax=Hellea balneolensis TaxID=287478 RepID=A0A7C5LXM6_9PROT|nr:septation protein IspZ [Hellea balneolensis]